MDELEHLVGTRGFFSRAEALLLGWNDRRLASARRRGEWHRFCHGYYTDPQRWQAMDPVDRHLLRADAACHQMEGAVVLSHVTGALAHGLAVWGVDLRSVHVTRLDDGSGRTNNGVTHHCGVVAGDESVVVGGRPVLPAARCAVETALMASSQSGLVTLDSALRAGGVDADQLVAQYRAMEQWPGALPLRRLVAMSDGEAESVGESRTRWLLRAAGVPAPVLQYEVREQDGSVFARCDMAWPELGVILEFDGRRKYERSPAPGVSPGDVVFAEKQREDRIRALTGFVVVRVVWADLDRPGLLARRVREAFALSAAARRGA